MLYIDAKLTEQEEKARDEMIYLFNPVLKFILLTSNTEEFIKYGCNSCRQTAILGAGYLRKLLPDYKFDVYEGHFIERKDDKDIPYDHAFIVAHKDERYLLIDLSRTTRKLIFQETMPNLYLGIEDYDDVIQTGQDLLDLDALLDMAEPEYFTRKKPKELMAIIESIIGGLKVLSKEEQLRFCDKVYSQTTALKR